MGDEQPDEEKPDANGLTAEERWALEKFEELRFPALSAFVLVQKHADWHRADELLRRSLPKLGERAHDWVFDQLT